MSTFENTLFTTQTADSNLTSTVNTTKITQPTITLTVGEITLEPSTDTGIIISPFAYSFIGAFWAIFLIISIIVYYVRRHRILKSTRRKQQREQQQLERDQIYELPQSEYRAQIYETQDV